MSVNELAHLFEESQNSAEYQLERAIVDFTEGICEIMENKGISRADLARRLGKSRAWVTKLLRGDRNLTLKTIVDVFWALDHTTTIKAQPRWESVSAYGKALGEFESQDIITVYTPSGQLVSAYNEYNKQIPAESTEKQDVYAAQYA